jgi:hypothetical protein
MGNQCEFYGKFMGIHVKFMEINSWARLSL